MMARRGVLGLMAGASAAILGGCALFGARASYRFRMTVEVETSQGLKSGSSVYQVKAWYEPGMDPSGKVRKWEVRGEAAAVDLPNGQVLFALLKTGAIQGDLAGMSMSTLDPAFKNDVVESAGRISGSWSTLRGEVRREDWPLIVRFGDLDDPRSVEQVDPEALGVRRITLETTGDAVTTGIEKRLGWLRDPKVMKTSWAQLPYKARAVIIHLSSSAGDGL